MAYDDGLAERIREQLREIPAIDEKRMFGGLAFCAVNKPVERSVRREDMRETAWEPDVLSGKVQTVTSEQAAEKGAAPDLKNDINGTWKLTMSDNPQAQCVAVSHNLQYGVNPAVKQGNLSSECGGNTVFWGKYCNGRMDDMQVKIGEASYYHSGSLTGDGKRIVGSYTKHFFIEWDMKKMSGTFEMIRQ